MKSRKIAILFAALSVAAGAAAETFTVSSPNASVLVSSKGARILSWKDAAGRENFFMPEKKESPDGDWSHGGTSICWPWFGRKGNKQSLIHGFGRNVEFTLRRREKTAQGETIVLGTEASGTDLEISVSLTDALEIKMKSVNRSSAPVELSLGLQSYFSVSDYKNIVFFGVDGKDFAAVDGMDKAFKRRGDRFGFRDSRSGRIVKLKALGNTGVVVWTPGTVEPANRNLAVDDCPKFIVIGPSARANEGAITLAPGMSHELKLCFESQTCARNASVRAEPTPVMELKGRGIREKCGRTNFKNRLTFTNEVVFGEEAFVAVNLNPKKSDTAWTMTTPRFKVTPGKEYALHLRACGDLKLSGARPPTHIGWLDAQGRAVKTLDALNNEITLTTVLSVDTGSESWRNTMKKGRVPSGAAYAHVQFAADYPNFEPGQRFSLSRIAFYERKDSEVWDFGDMSAPELKMITSSPSSDVSSDIVFELVDDSELDERKLRFTIDGADVTEQIIRQGRRFTYRRGKPWDRNAKVVLAADVADVHGNTARRFGFVSFEVAEIRHAKASLRDDGVVLKDGRPFFPIGIYSVRKCRHNGGNLDEAVRELKEGGINLIGTYLTHCGSRAAEYRELVDACNRYGLQFWAQPDPAHKRSTFTKLFATVADGLHQPCAFMWEIGDDTAFHRSADELRADHDACRAVDPFILTSHADISQSEDRVTPYAKYADIFKSENYPIRKETPQPGEMAELSRDLRLATEDMKRGGANPPCLFTIIQSFVGWGWKRYPSEAELRCMSYLAIALRVRGLTYYTYHSDNGKGVSSTPERMRGFMKLTREISALSDHLVSRDAEAQPRCEVLSGAKSAAYDQLPVAFLLKESGMFVAVNVTDAPLEARFTMPDGSSFVHKFERHGVCLDFAKMKGLNK